MPLTKVTSGVIAANAVVDSFGTQSITGDKIGLTAINANNIVNATITGAKLAATTITGDKITVGTLTGNLIAANTITGDDLGQNSVSANNIATNAIENYTSLTGRPLSNRNIIINGAMTVVQRNANTTAVTSDGYHSADRWAISINSAGTWSMNVDSVGVNRAGPSGTEFGNSSNLICTTADSSLSASDYLLFIQPIEGLNLQQVKKGTANAESLTLSFWVKSSNTGTYICELYDVDNSRTCAQSYTINSAGTWEKKTVTIPPDTTGRFDNDNANSLSCNFWLAAGTTFTSGTLNTTWASVTNANRAVGQLNIANRVGNYIAFTGIQLELGTVATPFEMRSYGAELALCQRYYYALGGNTGDLNTITGRFYATSGVYVANQYQFPVQMRASATMTVGGTFSVLNCAQPIALHSGDKTWAWQALTSGTGQIQVYSNNSGFMTFSAEL